MARSVDPNWAMLDQFMVQIVVLLLAGSGQRIPRLNNAFTFTFSHDLVHTVEPANNGMMNLERPVTRMGETPKFS
jgi:hypothetical protein